MSKRGGKSPGAECNDAIIMHPVVIGAVPVSTPRVVGLWLSDAHLQKLRAPPKPLPGVIVSSRNTCTLSDWSIVLERGGHAELIFIRQLDSSEDGGVLVMWEPCMRV